MTEIMLIECFDEIMRSRSNDSSYPCKRKVEGQVMDSRPTIF